MYNLHNLTAQDWFLKITTLPINLTTDILCNIGIQREEEKVKRSMKDAAKKGNKDVCIILAKEVLRSRKTINKLITSKTHLNSIQMQMKNQLCKFFRFF